MWLGFGERPSLTWSLAPSVTPSLLPGTVCAGRSLAGHFCCSKSRGRPRNLAKGPYLNVAAQGAGLLWQKEWSYWDTKSSPEALQWTEEKKMTSFTSRLDLPFLFCKEKQKRFPAHLCWSLLLMFSHHPQQGHVPRPSSNLLLITTAFWDSSSVSFQLLSTS